jgi:hypothetical protein
MENQVTTLSETGIHAGGPCPHNDGERLFRDPDVAGFVFCPETGERFLAEGGLLALADQVSLLVRREREREAIERQAAIICGMADPAPRPRLSVVREVATG